jgi:hypothetical protein
MLSRPPQSLTDLAWQTETLLLAETELREGSHADHPMLPKLFEKIRALAGTLPIPSVVPAEKPDPIFAAIEEHKKAAQAHSEQVRYNSSLEQTLPKDKRRSRYVDEIVETDDSQWIAALRALDNSSNEMEDIALNLLDIEPTVRGRHRERGHGNDRIDQDRHCPAYAKSSSRAEQTSFLPR